MDNKSFKSFSQNRNNSYNAPEIPFPEKYLEGGYFEDDEKKILKVEYITKYSEKIAKDLQVGKDLNKSSQLRKYYDFVVRIKDRLKYNTFSFKELLPEINRLNGYVTYAEGRKKVSKYFVNFISKNTQSIKTQEDFKAFATHFEAIIAYLPKDKN